ncbi:MAG: hypothetical protein ACLQVK_24365, partial [Acidimicrobiales bacterium]
CLSLGRLRHMRRRRRPLTPDAPEQPSPSTPGTTGRALDLAGFSVELGRSAGLSYVGHVIALHAAVIAICHRHGDPSGPRGGHLVGGALHHLTHPSS